MSPAGVAATRLKIGWLVPRWCGSASRATPGWPVRSPPTAPSRPGAGSRPQHPDVDPDRELSVATKAGLRLVCPGDDEWPAGLADLDRPGPGG